MTHQPAGMTPLLTDEDLTWLATDILSTARAERWWLGSSSVPASFSGALWPSAYRPNSLPAPAVLPNPAGVHRPEHDATDAGRHPRVASARDRRTG